jgi:hypothetical protein
VNGDGFDDVILGAPLTMSHALQVGRAVIVSGLDGSVIRSFLGSANGDLFGVSVAGIGDVDMDGYDDVIVGAAFADANGIDAGRARVFSGFDGSTLYNLAGDGSEAYFGFAVAAAGDVNADGYPDFVVGSPHYPNNLANGKVQVFSGFDGSELHAFVGDDVGDQLGFSVAGAGDVDGDGYDDIIAGADEDSTSGSKAGLARIWSGFDGSVLFTLVGANAEDRFGRAVTGAGDVDDDGFDDFAVSAIRTDEAAPNAGSVILYSGFDASEIFSLFGQAQDDEFGAGLDGGTDLNGDGIPDLCVGAAQADANGADSGRAGVYSGLPMRLAADEHELSLAVGGTSAFALDAGAANAGSLYWILGSVTGTSPGQTLGGVLLPLNPDPYFNLTINKPFLGIFGSYLGLLDIDGRANASFSLPPGADPGLSGVQLFHAYIAAAVFGQVDLASNAVVVTLLD